MSKGLIKSKVLHWIEAIPLWARRRLCTAGEGRVGKIGPGLEGV